MRTLFIMTSLNQSTEMSGNHTTQLLCFEKPLIFYGKRANS